MKNRHKFRILGGTARILFCAACLVIAAIFEFTLVGYSTLAMVFAFIAVITLFFHIYTLLKNRKLSRILTFLTLASIIIVLIVFAIAEYAVIKAARTDNEPEADYLIVLGAGLNGTEPSMSLLERLDEAVRYLEDYAETIVIVSGGQGRGEDITEAEAMRRYLEKMGVAPERIIMEDRATSTEENIRFSLDFISDSSKSIAILSSEYHLYRAKRIAESYGVTAYGVAANTALPVLRINYFIREALGVVYMTLTSFLA